MTHVLPPDAELPADIVHFSVTMTRRDGRTQTVSGEVKGFDGEIEFTEDGEWRMGADNINRYREGQRRPAEFHFRGTFTDPAILAVPGYVPVSQLRALVELWREQSEGNSPWCHDSSLDDCAEELLELLGQVAVGTQPDGERRL